MQEKKYPACSFGKLPQFGDFIRTNAAGPEIQEFDQWLQEGLFAAKNSLSSFWENTLITNFIFYSGKNKQFLVGAFKTSNDKYGRKYPYIASLKIDLKEFDTRYKSFIPVLFKTFFDKTADFLNNSLEKFNPSQISVYTENLSIPFINNYSFALQKYREYLTKTTLEDFFIETLGSFEDPKKYLLFSNLTRNLLPVKKQDMSRIQFGLRYPLGKKRNHLIYDICFWQDITLQLLSNPVQIFPNLFWCVGQDTINLFFYFRPPLAKNFIHLFNHTLDSEMICITDETGIDNIESLKTRLPVDYISLLENRSISLSDFLQRLW